MFLSVYNFTKLFFQNFHFQPTSRGAACLTQWGQIQFEFAIWIFKLLLGFHEFFEIESFAKNNFVKRFKNDFIMAFALNFLSYTWGFKSVSNLHLTFVLCTRTGQIISKGLFGVLEFSRKTSERIGRSSKNILFKFEDTKSPFEIIWPLVPVKSKVEISQNFVTFSEYMNFIMGLNALCL